VTFKNIFQPIKFSHHRIVTQWQTLPRIDFTIQPTEPEIVYYIRLRFGNFFSLKKKWR